MYSRGSVRAFNLFLIGICEQLGSFASDTIGEVIVINCSFKLVGKGGIHLLVNKAWGTFKEDKAKSAESCPFIAELHARAKRARGRSPIAK